MLGQALAWPAEPLWLQQVHGMELVDATQATSGVEADGCYSNSVGHVCVVLTADCLPILISDEDGTEVAALHAGWRGLAGGIIGVALEKFSNPPEKILAWLGPAIGPRKFEVGRDVYDAFVAIDNEARSAFRASGVEHWRADLYCLARLQFRHFGVTRIFGGNHCTYTDKDRFYSYRRDGVTGRMASLIWIEK
jgi:YfiH family protein